ncbi:MAG: alpha/beta hydrolase [Acidimicrobiales bacterium]|nr:alpha/beta hydrolase [Acidimicrobiales bacterium]
MAAPRQIHIETATVTIAGWDYGNQTARPMVLLHGLTDLAWSLHPVAARFAERFHVVNLDLRGHGDSSRGRAYTVSHFVADLRAVLDRLGLERPVLFGHSMGSIVTSTYAGTWPDEPAALVMVEGLGPPPRFGETDPAGRRAIARAAIEALNEDPTRPPMADLTVATQRLQRAHPGLDDALAAELAAAGTRPGPDGGLVWKWDPFVREWTAVFDRERYEECWTQVRCPTLVLTGGAAWERWWKPTMAARPGPGFDGPMRAQEEARRLGLFNDVEHHVLDAGHMVHFDAPDDVVALTDSFLRRRLPAD